MRVALRTRGTGGAYRPAMYLRVINLVTSPSRTADVEQIIQLGHTARVICMFC